MKKCWDEDPLKRPNASELQEIIKNWISNITKVGKSKLESINEESESENIDEELESENIDEKSESENINKELESKNIIEEFYKADKFLKQKQTNVSTFKSHPQAYHTSRLLDFTKQLNEILNQEENAKAEYSGMFYF